MSRNRILIATLVILAVMTHVVFYDLPLSEYTPTVEKMEAMFDQEMKNPDLEKQLSPMKVDLKELRTVWAEVAFSQTRALWLGGALPLALAVGALVVLSRSRPIDKESGSSTTE